MKVKYSDDADVLVIEFKDGTPVDSIDLKEGIILHLDEKGLPLEMEILDASGVVSMDEFNIMIPTRAGNGAGFSRIERAGLPC